MRPISEIAHEIQTEWKNVHFAAKPYLDAMKSLHCVSDKYGCDEAKGIILYFLSNAQGFRGAKAKELKAELKSMLKNV